MKHSKSKKKLLIPILASTIVLPLSAVSCFFEESKPQRPLEPELPINPNPIPTTDFHKFEIEGKDVYVNVEGDNWKDSLLFAQGYTEATYRIFREKNSNVYHFEVATLFKSLNVIFNNPISPTANFFPSNPIHGVTRIDGMAMKSDNSGIDDSTFHLTYFDKLSDNTPLVTPGYFCNQPTSASDQAVSKQHAYKILEGNKTMYYFAPIFGLFETYHALMYADRIVSNESSRLYIKFNQPHLVFSNDETNVSKYFSPNYNDITFVNELPSDIITSPTIVKLPATTENSYWTLSSHRVKEVYSPSNKMSGTTKRYDAY